MDENQIRYIIECCNPYKFMEKKYLEKTGAPIPRQTNDCHKNKQNPGSKKKKKIKIQVSIFHLALEYKIDYNAHHYCFGFPFTNLLNQN